GVQGAWRAWVPVYNQMIFAKLGDINPMAMLIVLGGTLVGSFIPYLGPVITSVGSLGAAALMVMAALRIQQKLGKDTVWIVLAILVSIVWLGILAFDKSRWSLAVGPTPWAQYDLLNDKTTWDGVPDQTPTGGPAPQWPTGGQPHPPTADQQYPPAGPGPQPGPNPPSGPQA
ncbi:MAG: DUF5684 domain-containing protein, partial [Propioniciclava sp.]